ncbi:hypothetical protein J4417_00690 [Candidatus Woesearchaeota archaeon]|nr:hypothetical protein [Candidatus Woesearchaeota archaeon]
MAVKLGKQKMEWFRIGHYTFFVGIFLAIVAAFFRSYIPPEVLITTLFILGLLVGLLNITAKETTPFLIAALALMLAGIVNFGLIPGIGTYIRDMLSNVVVFVAPAVIPVAIKAIWNLASER